MYATVNKRRYSLTNTQHNKRGPGSACVKHVVDLAIQLFLKIHKVNQIMREFIRKICVFAHIR